MKSSTDMINDALKSPYTSRWLKAVLKDALVRDPIDVCKDAEWLLAVLEKRCHEVMSGEIK